MKIKLIKSKYLSFFSVMFLIFSSFLIGNSVYASTLGVGIAQILGHIVSAIIYVLGELLGALIGALIKVAQYNDFIKSPAVTNGWIIVRDLCNMFFILILLVIAFATILRQENYSIKKLLPKLLIMAVLINFSKTICGIFIDFAQVIMLTFVNSFKDVGGANLTTMLGIDKILQIDPEVENVSSLTIFGSYMLALLYVIISLVVIVTIIAVLVMRMVMLWIYIVLSPLAYLLAAFPAGQKYASQWWSEFSKNVVVGPVLAFFIWLSFASATTGFMDTKPSSMDPKVAATVAGSTDNIIKFIISIGMLLGGLMVAQQAGGAAGSIAGKGLAALQKGKALAYKGAGKLAMGDNYLARKVAKWTDVDFRPVKLVESFKAAHETSVKKDEADIREGARKHYEAGGLRSVVAGMGVGEDYFNKYINFKGVKAIGKEIFTSPGRRAELGAEIDSNESEVEVLEDEQKQIAESHGKEITRWTRGSLKRNVEYKKFASNQADVDRINELKDKPDITEAEEKELERLKKRENTKSIRRNEIEEKTRGSVKNRVLNADQNYVDKTNQIKGKKDKLMELRGEMMEVQKPMAFEARSLYRKNVEEAKAKYKSITNADELQKAYADASQRSDKFDQVAILEKLSGDSNLNEELKTKGYDSNAIGLFKYVNNLENVHGDKKGLIGKFSDKERIQILNDLGESEERVGHWEMAKMCGMNSKGEMESLVKEKKNKDGTTKKDSKGNIEYDDMSHATASYAEVIKFDPQKIVREMNRLAMGGEDGFGKFQISNLGKMMYKYLAGSGVYEKNAGRILGNTAANLTSPDVLPILEKLMKHDKATSDRIIVLLKERGGSVDTSNLPDDMAAWLRNSGI